VGAKARASLQYAAALVVSLREKAMAAATAQTPAAPVRRVDTDVGFVCGLANRSATLLYASAFVISASRCSAKYGASSEATRQYM